MSSRKAKTPRDYMNELKVARAEISKLEELNKKSENARMDAIAQLENFMGVIWDVLTGTSRASEERRNFEIRAERYKPTLSDILNGIVQIKTEAAREDEGSMIESEKANMIYELARLALDDDSVKIEAVEKLARTKGIIEGKIDPRHDGHDRVCRNR